MTWKETTLGEVVELKRGYDLPAQRRSPGRFPIVSSSGVKDYHSVAKVRGPGVVTGRYGTIGEVFYIATDFWPLNTALYVRDFKGNDPRFISYFLRTIDFEAFSDKAAVPGINRNHLHEAMVRIPELLQQRAIGGILGDLDEKIELNRKMSQTLEEIAQNLFRAWFVDFEGETDLVDSELGPIPRGWKVAPIGDCIELAYGKALPARRRRQGTVEVYGSGGVIGTHDSALVGGPGIVVGRKGSVGTVYWIDQDFWPIDTTFYVKVKDSDLSLLWAYFQLNEMNLQRLAADSAVPGVNRNAVYSRRWCLPKDPTITGRFDALVAPIVHRLRLARENSRTLVDLRDALLPKLMSGEIMMGQDA